MRKFLLVLASTLLLFHSSTLVFADTISDKQKQIEELEKKVVSLQTQAKTLASQIVYYDSRITLTTLKISQSEDLIVTIAGKINLLEDKLQKRSRILERQIIQTYKQGRQDFLSLFLASQSFSDTLNRFKYLQVLQDNNRKFLHDTQVVQTNYSNQKILLEESRKRLETEK